MGLDESRVDRLERGDVGQTDVDAIRRYVEAVGGTLKIVADFEDHTVVVSTPERCHEVAC
jgi:hypothetical protein